jgi:hypothetical protein
MDTNYRQAISAGERLAITLRFAFTKFQFSSNLVSLIYRLIITPNSAYIIYRLNYLYMSIIPTEFTIETIARIYHACRSRYTLRNIVWRNRCTISVEKFNPQSCANFMHNNVDKNDPHCACRHCSTISVDNFVHIECAVSQYSI